MAEMMSLALIEGSDRWVLPLTGQTVTQCRVDFAFTAILDNSDAAFELRIEQPFDLRTADGNEGTLDPETDPVAMARASSILHGTVSEATASKSGDLDIRFDDGSILHVGASEDFEAWNIVGPRGLRVVSMPGGELAIWDAGEENGQ